MIGVYKETIGDTISSIIVVDAAKKDEPLPVVTYFHGFTSAKEHNLPIAYLLAEKGYRVILPDSKLHGDREEDISSLKLHVSFWDIVMQNVKEFNDIKNYLDDHNLILDERIGVAGTSMGGITTSAVLTKYPWIKTAAILMGSPKITTYAKALVSSYKKAGDLPITDEEIELIYNQLEELDLSLQPEKLEQRPLLFWHGDQDPTVPFDHSHSFYEETREMYKDKGNIKFLREKGQDHKVTRFAILETVKWFEKNL
ncbi:hypothetical protein SAMN05216389_10647 [Oceanobacillus limi]|uniref:Peptidase S9 prolyl oligopeptidase catalytic domain-containing protein n=1 Tax=Oceanobacillus limi TaxID=930131 RepID=A0A1I0C6P8_9BACI|nr:alpha/beta hydrolase [Oceanobacillus limi]SET14793.1 hypothetical protein SAMN05216389_10647 [Oceanobacillus limi]